MTTPTPPADPDPTIRPAQSGDAAGMHRVARLAYRQYVPRIGREPAPMTSLDSWARLSLDLADRYG